MKIRTEVLPGEQIAVAEQQRLAVDGLKPAKAIHPRDTEEAAGELRRCDAANAAVLIWGGGTQVRLGAPPARYDIAFSTDRLRRLLEYEPGDLTCRVESGMPVETLLAILKAEGQRLPLDPPHPERATVGGMVAANTSGLTRARYGTVRDWVIGITVAYATGTVARAGGKVVKNVAGYDLMKLHTGALGTLGVITEINLKVQTLPEAVADLVGHFEDAGSALHAGQTLARAYLAPAAAIVLDRDALWQCGLTADWAWTLALRLEGYRLDVTAARDRAAAVVREAGGRLEAPDLPEQFWAKARDWPSPDDDSVVLTGITPIARLGVLVDAAAADRAQVLAQPAAGVVYTRVPAAALAAMLARLRAAAGEQGQVVVSGAPGAAKEGIDVWGPPPPGFPIMRALKQALDPRGILNPGRFVGGI